MQGTFGIDVLNGPNSHEFGYQMLVPIAVLFACMTSSAYAQNQVVQQPVVRQIRIGTAVSVPDGGRAYLGGVSKGAMGANRYGGPFRSGTNSGREFSNSSMSVSVYIHDFEAMDEALLNEAARVPVRREKTPLSSRAAHAWRSLEAHHAPRSW